MKFLIVLSLLILGISTHIVPIGKRFTRYNNGPIMHRQDNKHIRVKVYNKDGSMASDKLTTKTVKYEHGKKVYEAMPITKDMMTGKSWYIQKPVLNKILTTTLRPFLTTTRNTFTPLLRKPILTTTVKPYLPLINRPILTTAVKPYLPLINRPILTTTVKPYLPLINRPILTTTVKPYLPLINRPILTTAVKPYGPPLVKPIYTTTVKPVSKIQVTPEPKPVMNNQEQPYFHCKPLKNIDNSNEVDQTTFNSKFGNEKFIFDWDNFDKNMEASMSVFNTPFFNDRKKRQVAPKFLYTGEYFYDSKIKQYCFLYNIM